MQAKINILTNDIQICHVKSCEIVHNIDAAKYWHVYDSKYHAYGYHACGYMRMVPRVRKNEKRMQQPK